MKDRLIHPNFRHPVRESSVSEGVHKTNSDVEKICVHLADYIMGLGYTAESQSPSRLVLTGPLTGKDARKWVGNMAAISPTVASSASSSALSTTARSA